MTSWDDPVVRWYKHGQIGYVRRRDLSAYNSDTGSSRNDVEEARSIRIAPGVTVDLYENPGYRGCHRRYSNCGGSSWDSHNLPRGCLYNDVDAYKVYKC